MKRILLLLLVLLVLSAVNCLAGELEVPPLELAPPEEAAMQTQIYENMSAEKFYPLCRKFLIENGYTMSFTDRDIGLIRGWKDGEGEVTMTEMILLVPANITRDCATREAVVFYLTQMNDALKVRVQFTVRKYEMTTLGWVMGGVAEEAITDPSLYSSFFDKLNFVVGGS